jgi:hypothetical protein
MLLWRDWRRTDVLALCAARERAKQPGLPVYIQDRGWDAHASLHDEAHAEILERVRQCPPETWRRWFRDGRLS